MGAVYIGALELQLNMLRHMCLDWVLIPLTFVNRFEISRINEENDPIEGSYVIDGEFDYNKINAQISDTCYKEWDYAFPNIALFAGWLDKPWYKVFDMDLVIILIPHDTWISQ